MIFAKTKSNYGFKIPSTLKCYDVIDKIDSGGFSVVFKVQQKISKKYFAAKIMSKKDIENKRLTDAISNEINILRSVRHQNIIKLFDAFEMKNDDNEELIVMIEEYCSGGGLIDYINKKGFQNINEKKKKMKNIIEAVKYLHEKNIAHCDIKIDNILLDENNNIKLCDFGFAKNFNKKYNDRKSGSYNYAAPELFSNGKVDFFKSDIWSLAVTLFTMNEKRFPYEDIKKMISKGFVLIMRNRQLKNILTKCFDTDPSKRPSANDILNEEYFSINEKEENNKPQTDSLRVSTLVNKKVLKTFSQEVIK